MYDTPTTNIGGKKFEVRKLVDIGMRDNTTYLRPAKRFYWVLEVLMGLGIAGFVWIASWILSW